ncbi:LOW QUALITY PROTEIN: Helitron helicase [Phytophthora megakarya]|uniref:Helitron helicase n=1 Tax=Phytophthora megakarya TaxID=4795 RepID=A0A225VQH7_9STRA|nr:LOW QUALITY PROTEIN: Helitron helicase [Phytophthora megakarya]
MNVFPGQTPSDRPDIRTFVFRMKPNALLDDNTKPGILEKVASATGSLEIHLIKINFAEIPDPELFPELHATVTTRMIHGSCRRGINSPCTGEDGVCFTRFPKGFLDGTRMVMVIFVTYGVDLDRWTHTTKKCRDRVISSTQTDHDRTVYAFKGMTDRIVPYNPCFCEKYNCHVNIEGTRERDGNHKTNTVEELPGCKLHIVPEACFTISKYEMQKNLITSTSCLATMKANRT